MLIVTPPHKKLLKYKEYFCLKGTYKLIISHIPHSSKSDLLKRFDT